MRTLAIALALIFIGLPQTAHAESQPADTYELHLSWSATTQQDSLVVTESLWTHCYLWVSPSAAQDDFVGYWGTLLHTSGARAHRWRYLGPGTAGDFDLNPALDMQPVAYLEGECDYLAGPGALFEFDVYIDAEQLNGSGTRASELSLFPAGESDWDPQVFFRVDPSQPCGLLSEGFAAGTNVITAVAGAVPNRASSFGALKAMYR